VTQQPGYNLDRTVFFSDAVIAIAMTLLALDLPAPTGDTNAEIWQSFVENIDDGYLAFVISFAVIAMFWIRHHFFFQRIARLNTSLVVFNLLGLFTIILVPFATRVLPSQGKFILGPVLYSCVMLLWGLAYVLMVLAAQKGRLWRDTVPDSAPQEMIFGVCAGLSMFAVSIPLAFINPALAQLSWILIPVVSWAADRARRRTRAPRG
jgi:uncharacterized membrane protein